jgi:hypothetical protein
MRGYYVYIAVGVALLVNWAHITYTPRIKEYIREVLHNNHWNFPHHHHYWWE